MMVAVFGFHHDCSSICASAFSLSLLKINLCQTEVTKSGLVVVEIDSVLCIWTVLLWQQHDGITQLWVFCMEKKMAVCILQPTLSFCSCISPGRLFPKRRLRPRVVAIRDVINEPF